MVISSKSIFTFPISSGILTPEHRKQIGIAIWEFLWMIDRTTSEYEAEGECWGKVLGGKPVKATDIAEDLGTHPETIKENIRKLEKCGYIRTLRTPRGQVYEVRKSIKWKYRHSQKTNTLKPIVAGIYKNKYAKADCLDCRGTGEIKYKIGNTNEITAIPCKCCNHSSKS